MKNIADPGTISAHDVITWIKSLFALAVIVFTLITTWIAGVRARARMKRAIGRSAKNEVELTSLNTWMKVEDEEERNRGGKLS